MGYDNELIEIEDEIYFVQGFTEDSEIQMRRSIDDLLEPEKDEVQRMFADSYDFNEYSDDLE